MKRSSSPIFEDVDASEASASPAADESTPPPAPSSAKKGKAAAASATGPSSPKKPKQSPTKAPKKFESSTAKGKLLAYIVADSKKMDRAEAERLTGLKPAQQRELMREDGKGALYNALLKLAEEM